MYATSKAIIKLCTAALIQVRVSQTLFKKLNLEVEPIALLLEEHGCAAFPSVKHFDYSMFFVPIVNFSNVLIKISAKQKVTAAPVALTHNSIFTAAVAHQLC